MGSVEIVGAAERRYAALKDNYDLEWRSFYNGFLEGAAMRVTAPLLESDAMLTLIDDMLSVYRDDHGTSMVTEERMEAWRALRDGWANDQRDPRGQ